MVLPDGVEPEDLIDGTAEPEWIFVGPGVEGLSYEEAMALAMDAERQLGVTIGNGMQVHTLSWAHRRAA
jgi:hypothetical protein